MTRKEFKELVSYEVFSEYENAKGRLNAIDRFWRLHLSPEGNAVYLIRKKQLFESRGGVYSLLAHIIRIKLMRRYGIHINQKATIGKGLVIVHASTITIGACTIGNNFTVYHNCTVGAKARANGATPTVGNNVTMYTNSSIIGGVKISNGVSIGAHSVAIHDCLKTGTYIGCPARLQEKRL